MRVIAIEEHMFPRGMIESESLDMGLRASARIPQLDEVGEARLRLMDEAGIDVQVLSALGWVVQNLGPERSVPLSRELNERLARTVDEHPERYRAFASLPMTDPEEAARELERCVERLGFLGAMIHGQTDGVFLDHPRVRPILAAAERLGVPIYLHPAPPPPVIEQTYYSGLPPEVSACLSTSGWGWHAEAGMHVLRMVVSGVFEELPALKIITGHMGEGIPFHLDRIQSMLGPVVTGQSMTIADRLCSNLFITTAGYNFDAPLRCALSTFGIDRVLFSVDHPFGDSRRATEFLRGTPVSDEEREKIAHLNAEALLGI
ncbi:MAG: amidohydrolase [Candidatus Leucobacter sulfamidivorax]|nr:amidohydrolase [Candidatus Leucobacter sulfamidivorax]